MVIGPRTKVHDIRGLSFDWPIFVFRLMRYGDFSIFEGPFVKRFALCYQTVICPVCDVGVLWPNGWTDQDTRRQDSAPPISRNWPTSKPNTGKWRNDVTGAALWREVCATQVLPMGVGPLRSDIKGKELPPANILIPLERQLTALQPCRWQFLHKETLQQTFRPLLSKLSKRRQI